MTCARYIPSISLEDYFTQGRSGYVQLQEKGGKEYVVPANHVLQLHVDAYIAAAGLASIEGAVISEF